MPSTMRALVACTALLAVGAVAITRAVATPDDLVLPAVASDGTPVRGAVARLAGADEEPSRPARDDGLVRVSMLSPEPRCVQDEALGFAARELELDPRTVTRERPLGVTLERLLGAVLRVRTDAGQPVDGLRVVVTAGSTEPFAVDGRATPRPPQIRSGASEPFFVQRLSEDENGRARTRLAYRPDAEGIVRIVGLRADVDYRLEVVDEAGGLVDGRPLAVAAHDEAAPVEIVVENAPFTVELLVRAPDGSPYAGAQVLGGEDEVDLGRTNADGLITIGPLYSDAGVLVVRTENHAVAFVRELAGESARMERTVTLSPGRTIEVRLREEDGAPVMAQWISAQLGKALAGKMARGDGRGSYRLVHVPHDAARVRVRVGQRTFEQDVGAEQREVEFVLPAPGSLLVLLEPPLEEGVAARFDFLGYGEPVPSFVYATHTRERFTWPIVLPGEYEIVLVEEGEAGPLDDREISRSRVLVRSSVQSTLTMSGRRR